MHNAPSIVEIGGASVFQSGVQSGGPGIRTLMSLRTPVFKTGAIAILPTLLRASLVRLRCCSQRGRLRPQGTVLKAVGLAMVSSGSLSLPS